MYFLVLKFKTSEVSNFVFPQYRKYSTNKSFFKIISESEFIEIQVVGKTVIKHTVKAKILPDRNLINDMLECKGGHWEMIMENEFKGAAERLSSKEY